MDARPEIFFRPTTALHRRTRAQLWRGHKDKQWHQQHRALNWIAAFSSRFFRENRTDAPSKGIWPALLLVLRQRPAIAVRPRRPETASTKGIELRNSGERWRYPRERVTKDGKRVDRVRAA